MRTLALVTCEELSALDPDEQLVLPALAARGIEARPVPWTAGLDALTGCDAVVLRSCWDYHLRPAEFAAYLDGLAQLRAPVWNPPHVLRWNLDKRHLLELEATGIPVLPTRVVERGTACSLADIFGSVDWTQAVVKPVISLGGWETWRVPRTALEAGAPDAAAIEARWAALSAQHDLFVQCYADEIEREGEWSLVFLAGAFSHAVIKRPAAGEFRVHEEYGGLKERIDPPLELIETAAEILDACPRPQLYARVDGVLRAGRFELMEVELLDPSLYLKQAPDAVDRWADRLAGLVR